MGCGDKRAESPLFMPGGKASDSGHGRKRLKLNHEDADLFADLTDEEELADGDEIGQAHHTRSTTQEGTGFLSGFPSDPAFHLSFPPTESETRSICDFVLEQLDRARAEGWSNEDMVPIYEDIKDTRRLAYPKPRPIALYGLLGKGKSSTMNSTLGTAKVAYEHSGPSRGTYVPHEYRSLPATEPRGYTAKVHLLDDPDMRAMVKKWSGVIVRHAQKLPDQDKEDESEDDDDESDDDTEDEAGLQEDTSDPDYWLGQYETARECLHGALCGESAYETEDKMDVFFGNFVKQRSDLTEDEKIEALYNELMPIIEQLRATLPCVNNVVTIHDIDKEACEERVNAISRSTKPKAKAKEKPKPSLWAFVLKVQRFYENRVLDAGVVTVDLPGIGDRNLHVVENAERGLKEAGLVLIFAGHERLSANVQLEQDLKKCIQAGKSGKVALVLPKSDTMSDFTPTELDEMDPDETESICHAQEKLKSAQIKIERIRQGKIDAKTAQDDARYLRLDSKLEEFRAVEKRRRNALRQAHIMLRCDKLKEEARGLLRKIERYKRAPDLKTFVVSNSEYQLHLAKVAGGSDPFLDIRATGIPDLTDHCLSHAVKGASDFLVHVCLQKLPLQLSGAESILTKSPLERADDLHQKIIAARNVSRNIVVQLKTDVLSAWNDSVAARMDKRLRAICTKAQSLVDKTIEPMGKWAQMHSCTFGAVCKRQGVWITTTPSRNHHFSQDIFEIVKDTLTKAFDQLGHQVGSATQQYMLSLKQHFIELSDDLTTGRMVNLGDFRDTIERVSKSIQHKMEAKLIELDDEVAYIRHNMTLEPAVNAKGRIRYPDYMRDDEDLKKQGQAVKQHMVGEAMAAIYRDCFNTTKNEPKKAAKPKKKGKGQRSTKTKSKGGQQQTTFDLRLAFMQEAFNKDNPENAFSNMVKIAKDRLADWLEVWENECWTIVDAESQRIRKEFEKRFQEPTVKTKENEAIEEKLRAVIAEARRMVDGKLKELVHQFCPPKPEHRIGMAS